MEDPAGVKKKQRGIDIFIGRYYNERKKEGVYVFL
jgi:hypothetical protein